ncbi:hypothetical protein So717_26720 [Roseobacter cerasinus]|uniref:Uncharacterized protein n=1 Tax=Roseobacter cerasinus TaxID=2602289 RepID=A0A640VSC7_9RHOB|nr:hypothetical protein [Roseobacter cerasinus]GFE50919.1 hypothetical protein So717_26720 [Roseobacter cerasinus]
MTGALHPLARSLPVAVVLGDAIVVLCPRRRVRLNALTAALADAPFADPLHNRARPAPRKAGYAMKEALQDQMRERAAMASRFDADAVVGVCDIYPGRSPRDCQGDRRKIERKYLLSRCKSNRILDGRERYDTRRQHSGSNLPGRWVQEQGMSWKDQHSRLVETKIQRKAARCYGEYCEIAQLLWSVNFETGSKLKTKLH